MAAHSLIPGRIIGHFRLTEKIGAGGMGTVYRAWDMQLERDVAVKVLKSRSDRASERSRLRKEALALSRLNHPNIESIYSIESDGDIDFLVFELLSGCTLADRIQGPLDKASIVTFGVQIAGAVAAAHQNGVIHRDLKPENIFLTKECGVKVLDFGLARMAAISNDESTQSVEQQGTLVGTLAYMAPEQIEPGVDDERSDIYSLGAVLYVMATGQRPFGHTGVGRLIEAILHEQPVRPRTQNPGLAPELERIILKCLDKNPDARYQSARGIAIELKTLLPQGALGPSDSRTIPEEEVAPTKAKRRPLYFGLAILSVAVATAATLALWRAAFRTPSPPKVLRFTRLTNDGQGKFGPMVTDGSRIYFNELLPGPRNLVVQVSVKGGEATSLSVPLALPVVLDLSRDGTELLVADSVLANEVGIQIQVGNGSPANSGFEPHALWVQPVAGGSPHRIGTILVADARFGPSKTGIIYGIGHDISSLSEDGSFSRKILSIDDNEGGSRSTPFAFRFSPDARVFRFTQYDSLVDNLTIMEAAADGAGLHKMFGGCFGEWTPDGRYFIFQDRHEGRFDLWAAPEELRLSWRKRDDKPTQLTAGPLDFRYPLPSKDGKEIFAIGTSRRAELVRYDAHTSQFAPFLSGISAEHVAFSRDGQWVTYISYPEGTLWRCRVDGSERIQLTFPPLLAVLPRWSPDGKQIAFNATLPDKSWNIYLISSNGGTAQRILPSDQIQTDANWSPDGKSLLFGSLIFRNAPIYTIDLMTKRVSPLPGSSDFFSPRWSPDGRHIAAITKAHRTLMLFDLATQKWTEAFGSEMGWEQWSHDGRYIYFLDFHNPAQGFHNRVVRLRLSDGKIENIVDVQNVGRLATGSFAAWFGLAPDDSPLFARDISTQEIYALEVDWP